MSEQKIYTYDNFPASTLAPEGMKTLKTEPAITCVCMDNIVFAERDGIMLSLYILASMDAAGMIPGLSPGGQAPKPKPLIIYVPGSAWMQQMLAMNIPQLAELAKRGYVIAVAQYRPSNVASFPAQIIDIKAAVKYMKVNAARYGADPDSCFIWGDSSGGHTVVMIGVTGDDILPCDDYPGTTVSVKGVIDFFGPTDMYRMHEEPSVMDHTLPTSPEGMLLGNINLLENPEKTEPANPINYISKERDIPPVLIIHGDNDKIVPFGQSVLLYEKLRDCGKKADFYKLEGADHGSGEFSSKAVYDLIDSFIKENT